MSNWSATDECKARGQSEKGGGGGGGEDTHLSVVVLGASGDLAKKMVFPSLFALHWQGLLPKSFVVIGHARSALSDTQFKWKVSQDWAVSLPPGQHTAEWDHKEKEACHSPLSLSLSLSLSCLSLSLSPSGRSLSNTELKLLVALA